MSIIQMKQWLKDNCAQWNPDTIDRWNDKQVYAIYMKKIEKRR